MFDIDAMAAKGGAVLEPRELEGLVREIESYGRSHPDGPGVTVSMRFEGVGTDHPKAVVGMRLNAKEAENGQDD